MLYADELLELARQLANLEPAGAGQASLRRAVSTAYYALFHLLISEATLNWARPELRSDLGRVFEHGKMKSASSERRAALSLVLKNDPHGRDSAVTRHLHIVTNTFVVVQAERNDADYNAGRQWTHTEVVRQIDVVATAFESWKAIREEPAAQAYLVSLLGKRPRTD